MGGSDVFPAEMPEDPSPMVPLDADTAERLLSGRLDPDDAPPGYAEVARLLQAASGPADPAEVVGEAAAMSEFRTARRRRGVAPGHRDRPWGRAAQPPAAPAPASGRGGVGRRQDGGRGRPLGVGDRRRGRVRPSVRDRRDRRGVRPSVVRGRLVALALAGAVVVAGVGVWTAGGSPFSRELRSPSGGPAAGGPGAGAPAASRYGPDASGAGSLRPAGPGVGAGTGASWVTGGWPPSLPSARERATARHGAGATSHGGGSSQGAKPIRPTKPPKPQQPKPERPKPGNPKPEKPRPEKANEPGNPKAGKAKEPASP